MISIMQRALHVTATHYTMLHKCSFRLAPHYCYSLRNATQVPFRLAPHYCYSLRNATQVLIQARPTLLLLTTQCYTSAHSGSPHITAAHYAMLHKYSFRLAPRTLLLLTMQCCTSTRSGSPLSRTCYRQSDYTPSDKKNGLRKIMDFMKYRDV